MGDGREAWDRDPESLRTSDEGDLSRGREFHDLFCALPRVAAIHKKWLHTWTRLPHALEGGPHRGTTRGRCCRPSCLPENGAASLIPVCTSSPESKLSTSAKEFGTNTWQTPMLGKHRGHVDGFERLPCATPCRPPMCWHKCLSCLWRYQVLKKHIANGDLGQQEADSSFCLRAAQCVRIEDER